MSTFLTQLPALLGVIIGAVATFGFSSLAERAKWKRAQSARWDERRLAAFVDYATAVKTMINLANGVCAEIGLPSTASPIDIPSGLSQLAHAEASRATKWETIQLLGDPETIAAARAWHESAWELEWYARGKLEGASEFSDAWRRAREARTNYYRNARASLLVASGDVPIRTELPPFTRQQDWLPQPPNSGEQHE